MIKKRCCSKSKKDVGLKLQEIIEDIIIIIIIM